MDSHPIVSVTAFQHVGPYTLRIEFDDGATQTIDFSPLLYGNIYGPLRDPKLFQQVNIDPDFDTLVWPNGADFDPATLRYWPEEMAGFLEMVSRWRQTETIVKP
jgi:hypothetical protein